MLSYNWGSKAVVSKVYDILVESGIKVWMDIKGGMGDNINISMAEGVEKAAVVCCFMTPTYQESHNCQLELGYANELAKKKQLRIIPCMIGDKNNKEWRPSSWLGLLTLSENYVNFRDDSDANIQLKTKELIERIKHQSPIYTPNSIPLPIRPWDPIRQKYLKENKIQLMINDQKEFPMEQSYINLALVETKDQQEKEKRLKQYNNEDQFSREDEQSDRGSHQHNDILGTFEEIYGKKTTIDVKDIFEQCKDQIKKVLMLGRAGIGKSTFCQYVTYRWAKGEIWSQYELVILIRLRSLTDGQYPSGKKYSPIDLVEREYFEVDDISTEIKQNFKDKCNRGHVLWILDGYDEFAQNIPEQLKSVFKHICETQHHILTSRPYAIALSYDTKMEITGFTNENIVKYIEQFFDQIKTESTNALSNGRKLLKFLKSNPNI
ncbi:unnamed protein product [Rotaria sordida]|uniref:NACHT domain-containing protein n=1 Tax=Rotaria sordida TaxID=392033 RepID=A0A814WNF9_9BILA|nr:unnamed protein product [Rotaria sordida]CAF3948069.1 unnamed protein product [Rotaria sordida]